MKLASLKSGRDGQLVVVSRDLAPRLEALSARLAAGNAVGALPFDPRRCAAPLPRAYHWVDGSAYVNHVELVRRTRGAAMPESFWTDPLVYQGGSDDLLGPTDDARFFEESQGIDLEGEVAVTPDELGADWRDGRVHRPLRCFVNGELLGAPDAGSDMTFGFPELLAHATRTRRAGAGTLLGSGTVSNRDRSRGSACLAERRTLEQIEHGAPRTPFLVFGDRVRIEMLDQAGKTVFGAIEQRVVPA